MALQVDLGDQLFREDCALRVAALVDFGANAEPRRGLGRLDEAYDGGETHQGLAGPVHGDIREEPVLGGEMIRTVTLEKTEYNVPPHRFEAGTPHVAGAIGLGAALDFVDAVGRETIAAYDAALLAHATEAVGECERRLEPAVFWRLRSHYP
jgi:hypothetical protein